MQTKPKVLAFIIKLAYVLEKCRVLKLFCLSQVNFSTACMLEKLLSVTAVRNCPEKDTVIIRMNNATSIWHKIDDLINICFLSPLKIIDGFFDS